MGFGRLSLLWTGWKVLDLHFCAMTTWQSCLQAAQDIFLFMEHKTTMRHLWVSRGLVECASTLAGGWPYNHGEHHGMAVLHPVSSWNNSVAKKYDFSSTGSSLRGRSYAGSFTIALSYVDPLISNNLKWLCGSNNGECFCLCLFP